MELSFDQKVLDPLQDSFSLWLSLPLSYRIKTDSDNENDIERIQQLNSSILEIILSSPGFLDINEELDDELRTNLRLTNAKIDLALSWLSKLLKLESTIPPAQTFEFNTSAIRFNSDNIFHMGELLMIQVYLDTLFCEPIRLLAKISNINGVLITAIFVNMHPVVAEKLDKYMFRVHRRLIAGKKSI